jgi:hypothetical protein
VTGAGDCADTHSRSWQPLAAPNSCTHPKKPEISHMPAPAWIIHVIVLGGLMAAALLIAFRVI